MFFYRTISHIFAYCEGAVGQEPLGSNGKNINNLVLGSNKCYHLLLWRLSYFAMFKFYFYY